MELFNKPKVFLSHSKKDAEFIEKLALDLRKCQIDYWLDTEEIRAGKSWQQVIFGEGIPSCNAVLAYFTTNSIESAMVKKEIDSGLIHQLSDSGVAFLPYVESAEIRQSLRLDIQTLQCIELNKGNYEQVLPSVVAEIWHSFMERSIMLAITEEKNKRLQLELKMKEQEDLLNSSPFSPAETSDFEFIRSQLNKCIDIRVELFVASTQKTALDTFSVKVLELIIS